MADMESSVNQTVIDTITSELNRPKPVSPDDDLEKDLGLSKTGKMALYDPIKRNVQNAGWKTNGLQQSDYSGFTTVSKVQQAVLHDVATGEAEGLGQQLNLIKGSITDKDAKSPLLAAAKHLRHIKQGLSALDPK